MFTRYKSLTINMDPCKDNYLLKVKLPFKVKSPIIIGKGVEPGLNIRETVTIKIGDEGQYFIIPSTSLKGVFRKLTTTIAYKIANKLSQDLKKVIRSHDEDRLRHTIENHSSLINDLYNKNKDIIDMICYSKKNMSCYELEKEDQATYVDLILSLYCPICSLYGSRHYAGAITFKPVIIPFKEGAVDVRYHVAIDRKTRTKMEKALYMDHLMYYVDKIINIDFIVRDLEPDSLVAKLLASTLEYISASGLLIGGGKSIGYGLLELNKEDVVWSYRRYTSYNDYISPITGKGLNTLLNLLRGNEA